MNQPMGIGRTDFSEEWQWRSCPRFECTECVLGVLDVNQGISNLMFYWTKWQFFWTTIIPQLELISDQETDSYGSDSTGFSGADSPINSQQGPFQAHRLLPDRANAPKLEKKCEARGQVFVFPCRKYFPGLVESLTGLWNVVNIYCDNKSISILNR